MENNPEYRKSRYREAQKQVKKLKGFYIHLIVYVLVNIFVLAVNMIEISENREVWNLSMISLPVFWGIGLAAHGISVFLPKFTFGKKWEEKKIEEILNKNK